MSIIPTTGSISLSTLQGEFGGTNPINLSEYYRNGSFVTPNNTGIPTSGSVSLSPFRGTYKTSTVASIVQAIYTDANFSTVRNELFSLNSWGSGFETSTALNINRERSSTYRFSTSVSATRSLPSTFGAAFQPLLSISGVTIVMRNVGTSSLTNALTVNGVSRSLTTVFSGNVGSILDARISYAVIPLSYNEIAGLTIKATYGKSSSNEDNLQELFILPGRWQAYWATTVTSGLTASTISGASPYDIIFGIRTGVQDAFISAGSWGGTATQDNIMQRNSAWYTNTSSHVRATTSSGTVTFTPGRYAVTDSSGNVTYTNHHGMACAFTCTQV